MCIYCMLVGVLLPCCQELGSNTKAYQENNLLEIQSILEKQSGCWNVGDLDCFMEGYWKSDSLKFIGKSGVTYGWEQTLNRYKKSYSGEEAMGKLKFDVIELQLIDSQTCFLIGKYELTRVIGDLSGHFTLLWKKINGQWKIVVDHSS